MFEAESSVLITGGTGSFGKALVDFLTKQSNIHKIVIFSRDELKQWELQQIYPEERYPQLRFFLGDVRDKERLKSALNGIDIVVHAAALKQVPAAEYNPMEFIKTNVLGADNLVKACLETKVRKIVALSTDKAAAPINLYGATKLCSDKLMIAANNIKGVKDISFSVVRYGNVMGSRGSVIPKFIHQAKSGSISITDPRMTRFNIRLIEGVEMVWWAVNNSKGGEIFVPKIPSYRITDVAQAIAPSCSIEVTGIRPGEKIHEEMITSSDCDSTIDLGKYYAILPTSGHLREAYSDYSPLSSSMPKAFSYNSGTNVDFLSVEQLQTLIRSSVDPSFSPV